MGGPGIGDLGAMNGILSLVAPLAREVQYRLNQGLPNNVPDPETIASLRAMKQLRESDFFMFMAMQGFGAEWSKGLLKIVESKLQPADIVSLKRRGLITAQQFADMLRELGYPDATMTWLMRAYEYFPSPPDLVRFAIREVYTPATRAQYGMDQDLPPKYLSEAYKAGLPEDQARNYWAAHWELPSTGQMFEMFQRDIIDKPALDLGLKSLDIMPYWREKLTKMAYSPLTRVDVRRMYGLHIFTEAETIDRYRYMGYSPEDARKLMEFTKRYEHLDADGLTLTSIKDAFKRDILTLDEFRQKLVEMNYTDEVVDFHVSMTLWEKMSANLDVMVADLQDQYYMGLITIDQLRQALTAADVPTAMVDSVINKTLAAKSKSKKVPSKSDLDDWLTENVIDERYYATRMKLIGYSEEDVENYLTAHNIKRDHPGRVFLDVKTYQRWLRDDIMTETRFIDTLTLKGISEEDIAAAILEAPHVK